MINVINRGDFGTHHHFPCTDFTDENLDLAKSESEQKNVITHQLNTNTNTHSPLFTYLNINSNNFDKLLNALKPFSLCLCQSGKMFKHGKYK